MRKYIGVLMMVIDNKFEIGQIGYLKTDLEKKPRLVTQISVTRDSIMYRLEQSTEYSWHYDYEIVTELSEVACI